MTPSDAQFIETVNTRELRDLGWPIFRALAPHFVEEIQLGRYVKRLLREGKWSAIHVVPHARPGGGPSDHVFDIYGQVVANTVVSI